MRVAWICLALLVVAGRADAGAPASGRIVLMTDRAEVHEPALAVTLGGGLIIALPPPAGDLLLDRAAAVQRATVESGADAGVWIDGDDVCVVSADGRALHRAPLPPGASPRAFAAIARSLLDEAFAPPLPADVRVEVHVDVTAPGMVPPVAEGAAVVAVGGGVVGAIAGAGAAAVVAEPIAPLRDRHLLELGAMVSPLTVGLEAELAWSVTPRWRFGMLAMIDALPFESHPSSLLWGSGAEVRRVGSGVRHFDVGLIGGAATAESDTVGFLSVRLGWVWERSNSGLGLSICPTLVFTGTSDAVLPAIWASLRWELPV
jgi:hypothetical protein